MSVKDRIYELPLENVGKFEFDEQVVRVFPDMIARSVPGYASILAMIGELAARYGIANSTVYDLGCSLGAATCVMQRRLPEGCRIVAVDSSPAMISSLRARLAHDQDACPIDIIESDIRDVAIADASLTVLNFTLQFIPPEERADLLRNIASGSLPGGGLVLSEKICFDDPHQQQLMTELHHNFKRAHGYSRLEIAQKRTALEETLIPETLQVHLQRLKQVGFSQATCWFQCLNFVSILAIK